MLERTPISGRRWRSVRRLAPLASVSVLVLCALVSAGATWGATAPYNPAADLYSMDSITTVSGAQNWWDSGYTGQGCRRRPDRHGRGAGRGPEHAGQDRLRPGSVARVAVVALRNLDTNGHGTFMAGLIAGRDSTVTAPYSAAPASAYRGMAPDARIVSLKVATADGGADVSQVIAAIDWVVQHAHDPGFNIRVINLSYGTNSKQSYGSIRSPTQQSRRGRRGSSSSRPPATPATSAATRHLASPIRRTTRTSSASAATTTWERSATATTSWAPTRPARRDAVRRTRTRTSSRTARTSRDSVFPVATSTRPMPKEGSTVATSGAPGTSEAAAIASGSIALVLQKYPKLTPDQVNRFVTANGKKVPGADSQAQGGGEIEIDLMAMKTPPAYGQKFTDATGKGSLELARGTDHMTRDGVVLTGEKDVFGKPFSSATVARPRRPGTAGREAPGMDPRGLAPPGVARPGQARPGPATRGAARRGQARRGRATRGAATAGPGSTWSGNSWSGGSWQGATWD